MKTQFRQGILSARNIQGTPAFLQADTSVGYINHLVAAPGTTLTFAHGTSNYIYKIHSDQIRLWGPLSLVSDQWIYWDVDPITAHITGGSTSLPPVVNAFAPENPSLDQHWFDSITTKMKRWNGAEWTEKIRIFAGKVSGGSIITHEQFCSQVDISGNFDAGYVVFDQGLQPIRLSNGQFFTTDYSGHVDYAPSMSSVKLDQNELLLEAEESIPAYSLICISTSNKIKLADTGDNSKFAIGMVDADTPESTTTNVIFRGVISNTDWAQVTEDILQEFSTEHFGKFLYLGHNGKLSFDSSSIQKVGTVVNSSTIYLDIDETFSSSGVAGPAGDKGDKGDTGDAGAKGDTGDAGATGQQGVAGTSALSIVDIAGYIADIPNANDIVLSMASVRTLFFAESLTGSFAYAVNYGSGSTIFDIRKNDVSVGTITFSDGPEGIFSSAGFSLANGNILTIVAPSTINVNYSNINITITATV